jgi:HEAT repeat protein
MPKSSAVKVTTEDLIAALEADDEYLRFDTFDRYCKQKPTTDAIPPLRRALNDDNKATVMSAAIALRKLGPEAKEAMPDLLNAAAKVDHRGGIPQSYAECVEAMAAIEPLHRELVPLIKYFIGLDNWGPLSASLRALKTIGTPEALDLMRRMATFWQPELNKMQFRVVQQILGTDAGV